MNSIIDNQKAICAFAEPINDHIEHSLDLNQYLIKHPAATFFVRAEGDSMRSMGILHGDLLIVDRSLTPQHDSIVIAVINGEFVVKRLKIIDSKGFLCAINGSNLTPFAALNGPQLWGVVTYAIHAICSG